MQERKLCAPSAMKVQLRADRFRLPRVETRFFAGLGLLAFLAGFFCPL
jgi:hypothetical protein